jgi:aspartate/methionine/tyrosine aminotransferase
MIETVIHSEIVREKIKESGLREVGKGSIREIVKLVNDIEKTSGIKYIRMEMGVPGLPSAQIGIDAEIKALQNGAASIYPPMEGILELKNEAARFLKLFANATISPMGCLPTVGSMQASMAAIMVSSYCFPGKNKTLFIDPGFPVQKLQCSVLGNTPYSFDVIDYRGSKLKDKIESYLKKGDVANILYSNPNNPTWVCLSEEELQIIAGLADKYNVIAIEDLAYFGMDFRVDIEKPGVPPYQPTIQKYTDNCILLISGSKVFSYAGQRIAIMAIPDALFLKKFPYLRAYFNTDEFGHAVVYGALYALSAGTAHSAQHALAAMFKAANEGQFHFINEIREYQKRAHRMKQLFLENGFRIVYDMDEEKPIGDGFYFTIIYPGFTGAQLMEELLYYGISAVTLDITGSTREGLRACVSQFNLNQTNDLQKRLRLFQENHSII